MCFLSQVALAHGGFNQPHMLSSELQAHDATVTQLQQEVIAVFIVLLTKICNKRIFTNVLCVLGLQHIIIFIIDKSADYCHD